MHTIPSPVLGPVELASLLRERAESRLLDVRTPGEFEAEHIAGAYNVPLDTLAEHGADIRANVSEPIVLVCRSGQRARMTEEALMVAGMANLHVLDGGMSAWTAAGQPVNRGAPRLSLERQVRIVAGALAATGGFLALFVHPLFAALPAFVVIAMNSASGFAAYLGTVHLDWGCLAGFTTIIVRDALVGSTLVARVPPAVLERGFALFLCSGTGHRDRSRSMDVSIHDLLLSRPLSCSSSASTTPSSLRRAT